MKISTKSFSTLGKYILVLLSFCHFESKAQDALVRAGRDSLVTIYFYRPGRTVKAFVGYDVTEGGRIIGHIRSGSVFEYRCKPGQWIFKATTEREGTFKLLVEEGKTYFVECDFGGGAIIGWPSFHLVESAEAKRAIYTINKDATDKIAGAMAAPLDTVKALQNLFQRKNDGGAIRGAIFLVLDLLLVVHAINTEPPAHDFHQGLGDLRKPHDLIEIGGFCILTTVTITAFTQSSHYNMKHLNALLESYKSGVPLPRKIVSKLREKDFK